MANDGRFIQVDDRCCTNVGNIWAIGEVSGAIPLAQDTQEAIAVDNAGDTASYFSSQPDWFDEKRVVATIDERQRASSDPDKMTITEVLPAAVRL